MCDLCNVCNKLHLTHKTTTAYIILYKQENKNY